MRARARACEAWRQRAERARSSHAADHLSLYQLTIEDGTLFAARHAAGTLQQSRTASWRASFYALTQELCDAAGLPAYEISNHARPGSELRHNLLYWRGHDYAGIGAGAHCRITMDGAKRALSAIKSPEAWLAAVEAAAMASSSDESLSAAESRRRISADGLASRPKASISPGFAAIGGGALDAGAARRAGARKAWSTRTATQARRHATGRLVLEPADPRACRLDLINIARWRRSSARARSLAGRLRALRGWRGRAREVPSDSRRNRPSTPEKPLGRVSCAAV